VSALAAGRSDPAIIVQADARAVLRRHGRTFFVASHLLGRVHASRAATLYAFCRHVDDLADDASDAETARNALAAVSRALADRRADDHRTAAMLALQAETGMPVGPALALVAGVTSDLDRVRIADEAQLIRYAWSVAGTVGMMMCAVLDVRNARAAPFAIDLGIAMQLTNIARDVGEDARLGRRYLPATWVGDLAPSAIAAPDATLRTSLQAATRRLLELAERYYASGEAGLGFLPVRARVGILAAARMYRAIGERIAAADYCSWDRRAVLGPGAKALHAGLALASFACVPRLHRRDALHDTRLQHALQGLNPSHG